MGQCGERRIDEKDKEEILENKGDSVKKPFAGLNIPTGAMEKRIRKENDTHGLL